MKTPDAIFFKHNREVTMDRLQGGLLVVAGYTGMQWANDDAGIFVQEGAFWYLCGIEFADWWLIIDAKRRKSWLVEPDIPEHMKLFHESLGKVAAIERSGVDDVITRDEAKSMLRRYAKEHPLVYMIDHPEHHEYFDFALNPAVKDMKDLLSRTFRTVRNFRTELAKQRAIKQPVEIEWIREATDLTADALRLVRKRLLNYKYDYEVQADITHLFLSAGADGHVFEPIIATGEGTATVHYFSKKNRIKKGTPLLLDIGVRLNGYSSDLARTYAVGRPTKRMEQIHAAAVAVERACMELLRPGQLIAEYHQMVDDIMKTKLIELKLMQEGDDKRYRQLFPHAIGHGLGVDVHESLGGPRFFEPGMVLTVEPGIYLRDEKFGVRIEDTILITEDGYENLSAKLPVNL
jgi:Xaa-Pro aminopeptidase